ncbi:uncharacterized protein LOC115380827 isoform X2 [Myripristis murdjan]|uniref:uncharacterized protein LOC115380827 isoform X2 n=1 Tax=Myripristis murdjan TaxID=586833 RepID=UPI001175D235|nr:uncharacterized protein LOC115380827 isoform X2 [Myripristis murdjan]
MFYPPNIMASRRRRQHSLPGHSYRHATNNVDQLALKYMMCKVESSTDSESEISPRWSDTSTMGCMSSTPESGSCQRRLPHKPVGRHPCYSLFLDPYDGSSEDSDESGVAAGVPSRRLRQQAAGGSRLSGRSRRFILHHTASSALREVGKNGVRDPVSEHQHLTDIKMKSGSESELWAHELDTVSSPHDRGGCKVSVGDMLVDSETQAQSVDPEGQLDDSGVHTTRSSTPHTPGSLTPVGENLSQLLDSSSERSHSPCHLRSLYKRKLGLSTVEVMELGQKKRRCVTNMEEEQEGGDSASEVY